MPEDDDYMGFCEKVQHAIPTTDEMPVQVPYPMHSPTSAARVEAAPGEVAATRHHLTQSKSVTACTSRKEGWKFTLLCGLSTVE